MDELLLLFRSNSPAHLSPVERLKGLLPSNTSCELYQCIHGKLGKKAAWKAFLKESPIPVQMYHQDEIPDDVRSFLLSYDPELPIVLGRTGKAYKILLTTEQIAEVQKDQARLIVMLRAMVS